MTDTATQQTTETAYIATGFAPCEKPAKYIQQVVSHWSHKMATSYDKETKTGAFPFSEHTHCVMSAREGEIAEDEQGTGIAITLTTADKEENERMRGVIERHIDRFAFREAPLSYIWTEQQ